MSKLLDNQQQQKHLDQLDIEWSLPGDASLHRVFKFKDYKRAIKFAVKVAKLAEKLNHHPEMSISYGKVEVTITTHSVGGLTSKDFQLAVAIDSAV